MAKKKEVVVEGVSFNAQWAATKTKAEFVAEFDHIHYQDYSAVDRQALLEKAYDEALAPAEDDE